METYKLSTMIVVTFAYISHIRNMNTIVGLGK